MGNLKFWNQCNQPPTWALKKIQAGRLKGKSDISPQWRYQVLTEMFGPCGIGWKFTIDKLWTEPGSLDQVFAFARISLFVKIEEKWSEPIPGTGGSMLVAKEKAGLYSSDEAYKMSVTDALSTACKMLGIAADIYAGLFDGAKYVNPRQQEQKPAEDTSLYANHIDHADRLIKLIDSDKTVNELNRRYKDNADMIKAFNAELKKKVIDAFAARKKVLSAQKATTPPLVIPNSVSEILAPQNEEKIFSPGEDNLPPIFGEEGPPSGEELSGKEKENADIKEKRTFLEDAAKGGYLEDAAKDMKKYVEKLSPRVQSAVAEIYRKLKAEEKKTN